MATTTTKAKATRRKPKPAPVPQPRPVCVEAILCRSDCPQYHTPHGDAWLVTCDCGRTAPGYACGACLRAKRITGCRRCMAEAK